MLLILDISYARSIEPPPLQLLHSQVGQWEALCGWRAHDMPVWQLQDALPLVGRSLLPARGLK